LWFKLFRSDSKSRFHTNDLDDNISPADSIYENLMSRNDGNPVGQF